MPKDHNELHADLQMVLAGHRTDDCLSAQITSLGATIGFATETVELADKMVDAIAIDLKQFVRENLDELRKMRAQAGLASRA